MTEFSEKGILSTLKDWKNQYTLPLRVCGNAHQAVHHERVHALVRKIVKLWFKEST